MLPKPSSGSHQLMIAAFRHDYDVSYERPRHMHEESKKKEKMAVEY